MNTSTQPPTIQLRGLSGITYTAQIFPWGTQFNPLGGVYVLSRATPKAGGGNSHQVLYVGQTGDLSERFDSHHKVESFRRYGATSLCVFGLGCEQDRLAAERDLIAAYNPPCNG